MPFVIPGSIGLEGLILDGLDLAQGPNGAIMLDAFTPPLFKKRAEWIDAADADGAILARDPLVSVGDATVRVRIVGTSRDDADTIIASIVDKLEEAERDPAGIPLVWTPANSTVSGTCYVLTGEITDLPVDWEGGYMVNQPTITFTLSCAPGWYGTPVTYTGVATAGPLVTLDLTGVPGDVPSNDCTLTVTDASSQLRRTVEWGAEHLNYNPASPWSLLLDSDSLVTSGFAGTGTTRTGAYDPGASGNNIIRTTAVGAPTAICGTGAQPHIGTFRVHARVYTASTAAWFRLSWQAGDGPYSPNDWAQPPVTSVFADVDLGLITVPVARVGTQSWTGRVEAYTDDGTAQDVDVDLLMLIPAEAGYGKAQASYSYSPGVISGRDSFTSITAGTALNTRTADAGGTWATSGDADDFLASDLPSGETEARTTNSDTSNGRFAILGTGTYTDVEVSVDVYFDYTNDLGSPPWGGPVARWTDANNHVAVKATGIVHAGISVAPKVNKVVAGVTTSLVDFAGIAETQWRRVRLILFASGHGIATLLTTGNVKLEEWSFYDADLASGGTLATGKAGFWDALTSSSRTANRYYDNFAVSIPAAEPIVVYSGRSLRIRSDTTLRESSAGGTWGQPQSYRGSRFRARPAGSAARTTRIAVKASRNDLDSAEDANLTDQITLAATVTPRWSVIPSP